jgi:hypothetical protein
MIDEAKRNELAILIEGEGYPPKEARQLSYELLLRYPERVAESLTSMRQFAAEHRQRQN